MMDCKMVKFRLDDYLDGELSRPELTEFRQHLDECMSCERRVSRAQKIVSELGTLPDAQPDEFLEQRQFTRLWQNISADAAKNDRKRFHFATIPAAAALMIGLVLGGLLVQWQTNDSVPAEPVVTMTLDEEKEVQFAVNASRSMEEVRLTLEIPEHMELANHPGERTLSWTTQLNAGVNTLKLPLRAAAVGEGQLRMRISTTSGYEREKSLEFRSTDSDGSRTRT